MAPATPEREAHYSHVNPESDVYYMVSQQQPTTIEYGSDHPCMRHYEVAPALASVHAMQSQVTESASPPFSVPQQDNSTSTWHTPSCPRPALSHSPLSSFSSATSSPDCPTPMLSRSGYERTVPAALVQIHRSPPCPPLYSYPAHIAASCAGLNEGYHPADASYEGAQGTYNCGMEPPGADQMPTYDPSTCSTNVPLTGTASVSTHAGRSYNTATTYNSRFTEHSQRPVVEDPQIWRGSGLAQTPISRSRRMRTANWDSSSSDTSRHSQSPQAHSTKDIAQSHSTDYLRTSPYRCTYINPLTNVQDCTETFTRSSDVKRHIVTTHAQAEESWIHAGILPPQRAVAFQQSTKVTCEKCKKKFSRYDALNRHRNGEGKKGKYCPGYDVTIYGGEGN